MAHPLLCGDIISEYSQAAVTATAGIADFGAPQSQTPERYSESVKRRNRILGGVSCERPPLNGAACNPSAPNFCASVGGQVGAQWTSAAHGTVSISNFGWNGHLWAAPLLFYEFQPDTTGTMVIDHAVSATGTDLNGIAPFLLNLAEQSAPFSAGQTPRANANMFAVAGISSSGQASAAIVCRPVKCIRDWQRVQSIWQLCGP